MTAFSCNKLNLCFDPLSVVGFWKNLAFLKAYDIRKRIAQVLQRNFRKLFANNPSKEICTFLVFLNYTSGYLKFCKKFCIFEMAWSRAFQKCIIFHFLEKKIFANIFTIKLDFAKKSSIFANLKIFLQILKVKHKSFPMMYHFSYLDIKHGI